MHRRTPVFLLFAASSLLVCAASGVPPAGTSEKPSVRLEVRTSVRPDGSGVMAVEIELSKTLLGAIKTFYGDSVESECDAVFSVIPGDWPPVEREGEGALICSSQESFADLAGLESLTGETFPGARFERLEIAGGRFYYELSPNWNSESLAYVSASAGSIDWAAVWAVEVPGGVVSANADESGGRILVWDMGKFSASTRLQAESRIETDSHSVEYAWMEVCAVILMLGCGAVISAAAGMGTFLLWKKRRPSETGENS